MEKMRQWTVLAVLAAVAILVGGWFLLVSPKKGEVGELRTQTATQVAENQRLKGQIDLLKKQQADLPRQKARLAEIAKKLPNNPALPALIRSLNAVATDAGVTLVSLAPSPPVFSRPPVTAPGATSVGTSGTTGATAPSTTGTTVAGTTPSTVAPVALANIPLKFTVKGGFYQVARFVSDVEGLARSLLIGEMTIATNNEQGSTATVRAPLQADFVGRVFMTVPRPAAPTPVTPPAPAS